jgi:hypothetical protein
MKRYINLPGKERKVYYYGQSVFLETTWNVAKQVSVAAML